ncbi:helix-turn-helix domain-containing protein [Bacillus smithii]|uniref:helix-turn-helix domain-containing protein n=1 Tax=Bacillus smithii TaxID=1479 RepID=UPI00065E32D9|nr:helix-turn-helix transcriptional regulator [Bacillus smithii]AKP48568.1 Prophage LambdaBa02repressor protein [Bacillus smithii]MED4885405.1 helix-turn-helix transcriptional regulator [Bacillus smithii]MED4929080.1 helix-turn-helix transcriptional regulator [Bacillus smithii]
MASLGERIKELRVSKDLTQSDIAELLNITTRQEQRYESDKSDMPISKAVTLADFFDVSLDYLVGRSDDPTRK